MTCPKGNLAHLCRCYSKSQPTGGYQSRCHAPLQNLPCLVAAQGCTRLGSCTKGEGSRRCLLPRAHTGILATPSRWSQRCSSSSGFMKRTRAPASAAARNPPSRGAERKSCCKPPNLPLCAQAMHVTFTDFALAWICIKILSGLLPSRSSGVTSQETSASLPVKAMTI